MAIKSEKDYNNNVQYDSWKTLQENQIIMLINTYYKFALVTKEKKRI